MPPNGAVCSRIWILGASGSGKTTLASELAQRLRLPRYELDELFWQPGWRRAEEATFLTEIARIARSDAWIIDGQYKIAYEVLEHSADIVIWLDPPAWLVFTRLIRRAVRYIATDAELWNGNRSTVAKEMGLLVWATRSYGGVRRRNLALLRRLAAYGVTCAHVRTGTERTDLFSSMGV
jgi:adenylate kinase family enzyme